MRTLHAGSAVTDITPSSPMFLFGYPHVERYSTGVHDRLMSSALYLSYGANDALFVANDIVFIPKDLANRARCRITDQTGVSGHSIMITATHTHSGPMTVDYLSNEADPVLPRTDPEYLGLLEDRIVEAAVDAHRTSVSAELGLALAECREIGTNRRDPLGKADPEIPVLMVREIARSRPIACMIVCSMHPTVLHEDSTLISGDFPAMARKYVQQSVLGEECPVLHHTGPSGDQSPRHVTRENTFAEADRLGRILGTAIERAIHGVKYRSDVCIDVAQTQVDLPPRSFPSVEESRTARNVAAERLKHLREQGATPTIVRTAEVDWFGAEESLTLAKAAANGRVHEAANACLPAEIQVFSIGPWGFVGWPGEIFVGFALEVKKQYPGAYIISLANGELQGYIVDEEAARIGGYEAGNALFGPESGRTLVNDTLSLINNIRRSALSKGGKRPSGK